MADEDPRPDTDAGARPDPAVPAEGGPRTVACVACPEPVNLAERHVTLARLLEQWVGDTAYVLNASALAHLHVVCAERVDSGEIVVSPETLSPEPMSRRS